MKKEILAPVGSYESLLAAVHNGCNAIYLGGQRFGARAFANNFDNEKMVEAIRYCHRYGVNVYVTVNTLIHQDELDDTLGYIDFLHQNNVDAIIVQDHGILHAVRNMFPNLAVHASTQMHVHNVEGVQFLRALGLTRVVLSRECSIHQIREIHEACPDIELEVFVYGAHCVSYSGQCLMSSMIGNRSGNRGACAQPCRLPYDLIKKRDERQKILTNEARYLISMKDLNTIDYLPELLEAGVTSFKIEGRMKRPEYVAKVVSVFQQAFNAYDKKQQYRVTEADHDDLLKLFNRGFTPGHIFDRRGSDIVNVERPNHIGVEIGEVVYVHPKEKRIGIRLHESLYQLDGIRFLGKEDEGWIVHKIYRNDLLVNQGSAGETIEIDYREGVAKGSKVLKTSDVKVLERLRATFEKPTRKVAVTMDATIQIGQPMELTVSDDTHTVTMKSDVNCEKAINQPLRNERLSQQLDKLNDTPFQLASITINNDNLSILPISQINQLRRAAIEQLIVLREEATSYYSPTYQKTEWQPQFACNRTKDTMLSCSVYTKEQLDTALASGIQRIYVHNEELHNLYPDDDRIIRASKRVNEDHMKVPGKKILVRELGALQTSLQQGQAIYIDDTMNLYNTYTAAFFQSFNAKCVTLSNELNELQLREVASQLKQWMDLEFTVYGRVENMLLKHCVINEATIDTKQKDCNLCRIGEQYYLKDRKEEEYPILTDRDCFSHILHHSPLLLLDEVDDIVQSGVNVLRLNFTIESASEMKSVIEAFQAKLNQMQPILSINHTKRFFHVQ